MYRWSPLYWPSFPGLKLHFPLMLAFIFLFTVAPEFTVDEERASPIYSIRNRNLSWWNTKNYKTKIQRLCSTGTVIRLQHYQQPVFGVRQNARLNTTQGETRSYTQNMWDFRLGYPTKRLKVITKFGSFGRQVLLRFQGFIYF